MPFIENQQEFIQRQDCGAPRYIGKRYLFENGAQSFSEFFHIDPPKDKYELARLQHEFLADRLEAEAEAYTKAQTYWHEQSRLNAHYSNPLPMPPDNFEEQLEKGRQIINDLRKRVKELAIILEQSPQAQAVRAQRSHVTERQNRARALAEKIATSNI